jgi:hypothetical protein
MFRAAFVLVALLPCLTAGTNSAVYANSKTIQASCNTVWPAMLTAVTKNGFSPELSDRAGGILRARFTRGESLYRGARNDMNALTVNPSSRWAAIERFRVESVVVTIAPAESACSVTMQVQYAVLKNNVLEHRWVALESNGRLEWMMISETDRIAKGGGTPSLPETTLPEIRQNGTVPLATPIEDNLKSIVVRFTSTPAGAEVIIDGEYWGSTPTTELTRLSAGTHAIVVKKVGCQPWERKITVAPGDDRTVSVELQVQPNDPTKPRIVGN